MVVILMGVSGAGKTTVGRMLADALGWDFRDGDDLHPAANRDKMKHGAPLSDADRMPWLDAIRGAVNECLAAGRGAVIACSALKQSYRELLIADPARVKLVWLDGSRELIAARLARRRGHFMPPELLASQFADLEPPADALRVEAAAPPAEIVAAIRRELSI
ncbi:MAG TPA: gluconokinase [Candidatus Binataceae bacterium]|nr:gluconokinase [Candidatus Binataceae bacterium]